MPRIDPLQLLRCLQVLLGPHGGIKSAEDVARLVSLMSKFSKKLVSKCIYLEILQATDIELLRLFMKEGGWDLVSTWIIEAVTLSNGALLEQLLALTLRSPLDLAQLQINSCPRVVKDLTREAPSQRVRELALMLVEAWVQMARGGCSVTPQAPMPPAYPVANSIPPMQLVPQEQMTPSTVNQEYLQQQPDPPQFVQLPPMSMQTVEEPMQQETVRTESIQHVSEEVKPVIGVPTDCKVEVGPEAVQEVEMAEQPPKTELSAEEQDKEEEEEEEHDEEEAGDSTEDAWDKPLGQLPVYRITISPKKSGTNALVFKVVHQDSNATTKKLTVPATDVSAQKLQAPKTEESTLTVKKEGPRGAARRKQQLKPSQGNEPVLEMSETERKKVATQEKISARMAKEQEAKRTERMLKEKQAKLREKLAEREAKEKERRAKMQEEKDQATLAKLNLTKVASMGKIPKKIKSDDKKSSHSEDRKSEHRRSSSEDDRRRSGEDRMKGSKDRKDRDDSKKSPPSSKIDSKKDPHKSVSKSSPSTNGTAGSSSSKSKVKSFSSKPRSTGLEEQPPPPPSRSQNKKDGSSSSKDKRPPVTKKRSPPPVGKDQTPPDKKPKLGPEDETKKQTTSKSKLKPSIPSLQESGFFMDALTAMARPEPRKRKRRISSSKDEQASPSAKPEPGTPEPESPTQSPREGKKGSSSPSATARPNLQFYTETLDTKLEDEHMDTRENEEKCVTPAPEETIAEEEPMVSIEVTNDVANMASGKGVLVLHRSADRVKKSVRFREENNLCSVLYFELDETERVNVTRTFGDLRLMELEHERELLQNAKRMAAMVNLQEDKMPWPRHLILVDCPGPLVEPGRDSKERDIQLAREKTTLQALYFSTSLIPDSPAEPDPENHAFTEPKVIPIEDATGNPDSTKDFSAVPWPEPKHGLGPGYIGQAAGFAMAGQPSGGWRTGDGQVLAATPGDMYPGPNSFMPPHAGYETGNPGAYNYGYETPGGGFMDGAAFGGVGMPPDMHNGPMGPNNFMFNMPGGPGNFRQAGPGNWGPPIGGPGPMNGPMMGPGPMGGPNDGRGGPRFRGHRGGGTRGAGGNWPGPARGGGPRGGGGWGSAPPRTTVCKHFRSGYCRNGETCNFLHPGVNGPPTF